MPQAFKFGFGDEDIEVADVGEDDTAQDEAEPTTEEVSDQGIAPCVHSLDDILYSLPSSIQYNAIQFQSPHDGTITLARRELFDIRAQLMAEDTNLDEVGAGLSADDIKPKVYEGGFKTWECSVDLANYLLSHTSDLRQVLDHSCSIIELGAGTALPTLLLFHILLSFSQEPAPVPRTLVLADYNPSVLHLVTIPNLVLTYALTAGLIPPTAGELEITPALLTSFHQALNSRNILIRAVAGNWSPQLAALLAPPSDPPPSDTLILAGETIYSPASTLAFTICLIEKMRRCEASRGKARALVAAKKVYFGVGGGVDEFLGVLSGRGGQGRVIWETDGVGSGVERCIVEVKCQAG